MSNIGVNEVEINGVTYVRSDSVPAIKPNGIRAVVVVDRGWIFAGDVTEEDGRIVLSRAVWVMRWESIGFDGMIANPGSATIKEMPNGVDFPIDSEIFRVPVDQQWGL